MSFSGSLVVWSLAGEKDSRLMAADIRVHKPFRLLRADKDVALRRPVLDGHTLIWQQRASGAAAGSASLWRMDIRTRAAVRVAERSVVDDLDVSAGQIVWLERKWAGDAVDDQIWLLDVHTGHRLVVPAPKGPKTHVAVDRGIVVWSAARGGSNKTGIWFYEPLGKTVERVSDEPADSVDLSGSYVVWVGSSGEVRGCDLATGARQTLSRQTGTTRECRVDESLVVWWDRHPTSDPLQITEGDVYGQDLHSGQRFPIHTQGSPQRGLQVSGKTVVWTDTVRGDWVLRGAQISR